jgi:pyruvyl transferase EpsO
MPELPTPPTHGALMTELAAKHQTVADLVGGRSVQYVDVPMYANVGDLLIMLGTERFFEAHAIPVCRRSAYFNFRVERVAPDEVIMFQGGGNFGDLYEHPQSVRDANIPRLHAHRVIILPQSLHFQSTETLRRTAALYRQHPDLHICVRDPVSFETAQAFTDHVHLLPDMAHQLWPIASQSAPVAQASTSAPKRTLQFMRTDSEIAELRGTDAPQEPACLTRCDWPHFVGRRDIGYRQLCRALRLLHALRLDTDLSQRTLQAWRRHVEALVAQAATLFSAHEQVVTDRLHGHIFACLLDIPNQVLDNAYGKNSRYVSTWTQASPIVELTSTVTALAA